MTQSQATGSYIGIEVEQRYPRTILGTCCVPWRDDWSLDEDMFRAEIRGLLTHGYRDLYVFGTAGEGYAVSDCQFDQIVGVFREETDSPDVRPMVGVISLSLATIIERIERAAALGFGVFQIALPSWGTLNDRELMLFFQEVCGRFPKLRFLHYNLVRAGRILTAKEYAVLAEAHPNLVATKLGGRQVQTAVELVREVPQVQHFLTEHNFAAASLVGPCSLLASSSTSNLQRARWFFQAGVARDADHLRLLAQELVAVGEAMRRVAPDTVHMDGGYDKLLSRLHLPQFPLRLLPPYEGISEAVFDRFRAALAADHPQWLPSGLTPGPSPS